MWRILFSGGIAGRFLQVVPIALLAGLVWAVFRLVQIRRERRQVRWGREVLKLLCVCYVTGLVNLVLVPERLWPDFWYWLRTGYAPDSSWPAPFSGGIHLVPIFVEWLRGELTLGSWVLTMLVGNLLMFVPLGFFWTVLGREWSVPLAVLRAAGIPLAVEVLQWGIGRSADVDDFLLNAAGILAGTALAWVLRPLWREKQPPMDRR